MKNILTIDEDALFECSNDCLNNFPRIQSVKDYLDINALKNKWNNFYDIYESSFNLRLNPDLIQIYFSSAVKTAKVIFRVDNHDEVLKFLNPNDSDIFMVNIDQHHDQSLMHSRDIDCSNWASPNVIYSICPQLKRYYYRWFYSPVTTDFNYYEGDFENYFYSAKKKNIKTFKKEVGIFPMFDIVIFCKSRAYVPSNYWYFFDALFEKLKGERLK